VADLFEGQYWLPENRKARLDRELDERGLPADGSWLTVLDDSAEQARQRICARYDFPPASTWLDIHYLLTGMAWLRDGAEFVPLTERCRRGEHGSEAKAWIDRVDREKNP
jgi:hypothetical protein